MGGGRGGGERRWGLWSECVWRGGGGGGVWDESRKGGRRRGVCTDAPFWDGIICDPSKICTKVPNPPIHIRTPP